jgi:malic enzyme
VLIDGLVVCVCIYVCKLAYARLTHSLTHVLDASCCTGNNAYVFPGIGLGVLAAGSTRITNHDMLIAAQTLAALVTDKELQVGCLYPPLSNIREVAAHIAAAVALNAHESGVATKPKPADMLAHVKSLMYDPFANPFGS